MGDKTRMKQCGSGINCGSGNGDKRRMAVKTRLRKCGICYTWNERSGNLYYQNGKFVILLVKSCKAPLGVYPLV